jgi:hypothetical protein
MCENTTDRMKREQLCITARNVSVTDSVVTIHEDPICLIDAVKEIAKLKETSKANGAAALDEVVRSIGRNVGSIILKKSEHRHRESVLIREWTELRT